MNVKKMTMGALSAAMVAFGAGNANAGQGTGSYSNPWQIGDPTPSAVMAYTNGVGELTITGTGAMHNFSNSEVAPWANLEIKSVIIYPDVTSIGNEAFMGLSSLTNVLTSLTVESIGNSAFFQCWALQDAPIVPGVKSIGEYAFLGCSSITSLWIPPSVESIGRQAFAGAPLTIVTVNAETPPTAGVEIFGDGASLTAIYVPERTAARYKRAPGWSFYKDLIDGGTGNLPPAAIAAITVGTVAAVGVGGHFIGRAVSEAIGQKKGHPTYKLVKQMTLSVPDFDAKGYTYKNKLIYHPAKGTLTGRVILEVQKGKRTAKIYAKATGAYQEDGTFVGTLDAKGYGKHGFILGIAD